MKKLSFKMESIFRGFVLVLPAVLYFSYYPVMSFGSSESMNFELSLPLLWLVLFDVISFYLLAVRRKLVRGFGWKWLWLLFPAWLSLTVLWSLNSLRGLLTVGILWLLYFAVYGMWQLKGLFDDGFGEKFLKWFFIATLIICGVCVLQCVLDLIGVSREYSLMCAGCTSLMFGFPHPNGLAIEPQFMGNLLLAPALLAAWFAARRQVGSPNNKKIYSCFSFIVFTIFLIFSRGAIYAFLVAMIFMTIFLLFSSQQKNRKDYVKNSCKLWGMIIISFAVALNFQGLMAQLGPTNDTYLTGVSKAINHLSLGVIDMGNRHEEKSETAADEGTIDEKESVEKLVENSANFDGYVAESTDTRLRLSGAGISVWRQNFTTAMFGVGLGGAGQALYINKLSPAPKEIVQNEYVSLLLETGLIGVLLFVFSLVLIFRVIRRSLLFQYIFCLMVAYGVSLLFFSGIPNALHIILIPSGIFLVLGNQRDFLKKLVS